MPPIPEPTFSQPNWKTGCSDHFQIGGSLVNHTGQRAPGTNVWQITTHYGDGAKETFTLSLAGLEALAKAARKAGEQ